MKCTWTSPSGQNDMRYIEFVGTCEKGHFISVRIRGGMISPISSQPSIWLSRRCMYVEKYMSRFG